MVLKIILFMSVVAGYAFAAQTVSLNGVVSNKSGKPIPGAIVTLVSQKLSDTTDAAGAYSFSSAATFIVKTEIQSVAPNVSLNNGVIAISLPSPSSIGIQMFDLKGNLLENAVSVHTTAGEYNFNIGSHRAAGEMILIRVTTSSNVMTLRYLPIGHSTTGSDIRRTTEGMTGMTLAKVAGVVDSLRVTKPGYTPASIAVSSFTGKQNVTLDTSALGLFSFFVTSLKGIQDLSKSENGFGGDLRFGKTGQGAGLLGADSICQCLAERSMPGSKVKQWRAFLSATIGPDGNKVNAIDRIGNGPWYDRLGRLVSTTKSDLQHKRPNADDDIIDDLPNEDGVPNHRPDPTKANVDNHQFITGSDSLGKLYSSTSTCQDWTSVAESGSKPRAGLSWPQSMGSKGKGHWISTFDLWGCAAGLDLTEKSMIGTPGVYTIGNGGGYGGFYCFALAP
jgi:hypothetical protein